MSASRWSRPITTRRCTEPICCANRNPASRASVSQSLLIAFVIFATVMFFTPGPNNIMLLSSGLTYGFRRTLPHVAGIVIGFAFMVGAVGLGLGTIFITYPLLQTILKYPAV